VRELKGLFKLTMTGTPVENHPEEYYSIIDLALPGLLGEYEAFKPMVKAGAGPGLELVIRRTRPFVLRRTKEAVLKDLPPKTETDIYLELNGEQKVLYQKTVEQVRSAIDEAYQSSTQTQAKIIGSPLT
jgi:SNF2 family DNA or RNA helicase